MDPELEADEEESQMLEAPAKVGKEQGKVLITSKRLMWQPSIATESAVASVDCPWTAVKSHQVSANSTARAMMKLNMKDPKASSVVIEFLGNTPDEARASRNQAKDLISMLLAGLKKLESDGNKNNDASAGGSSSSSSPSRPSAGATKPLLAKRPSLVESRIPMDIQTREALLASDPVLKQQHDEMVGSGLVNVEEFWATRQGLLLNEIGKRQKTGPANAFLSDIRPEEEPNSNRVKYKLNVHTVQQIFAQYPAVHLAYKDLVPDKMTEKDFWYKYFQSKYFHRDRGKATGKADAASLDISDDLFAKYDGKAEKDKEGKAADVRGKVDRLMDLIITEDGRLRKSTLQVNEETVPETQAAASEAATMVLAKFNRHAQIVLDPLLHEGDQARKGPNSASAAASIRAAVELEDLEKKSEEEFAPLKIQDERMYFDVRSEALPHKETVSHPATSADVQKAMTLDLKLSAAFPNPRSSDKVFADIMSKAAPAGAESGLGLGGGGGDSLSSIPPEFKTKIFSYFHSTGELLRHFWAFCSLPPSAETESKLDRIVARISSKYEEIETLRRNLPAQQKSRLGPVLKPLLDQLNNAIVEKAGRQKRREERRRALQMKGLKGTLKVASGR